MLIILHSRLSNLNPYSCPTPHLPWETLSIPESTSTPAPPRLSFISQTRVPDAACVFDPSASATTGNAPIELVTEAKVSVESSASPISFSSWNTSSLQWERSQTCVASFELPSIETLPHNVTIDLRNKTRRPYDYASKYYWSPLPPPGRI